MANKVKFLKKGMNKLSKNYVDEMYKLGIVHMRKDELVAEYINPTKEMLVKDPDNAQYYQGRLDAFNDILKEWQEAMDEYHAGKMQPMVDKQIDQALGGHATFK